MQVNSIPSKIKVNKAVFSLKASIGKNTKENKEFLKIHG